MPIKLSCISEIEDFITAKINFEFAVHEKEEHKIEPLPGLPELGRDIQVTRSTLNQCLLDLAKK